ADAGGAACGGAAGARRGADWRPEPREPGDHRAVRARARHRRDSQAAKPASHRVDAGVHESFRPGGVCAIDWRIKRPTGSESSFRVSVIAVAQNDCQVTAVRSITLLD